MNMYEMSDSVVGQRGDVNSPCLPGSRCNDVNAVCDRTNICACVNSHFLRNNRCGQSVSRSPEVNGRGLL